MGVAMIDKFNTPMKLTRVDLDAINSMVGRLDTFRAMLAETKEDRQFFFKRELRKGEDGKTSFAFIDHLTQVEVAALTGIFQHRIDSLTETLNELGLKIIE